MCCYDETPEFEIRIKGRSLVKVNEMGVRVEGQNFHADLKDLAAVAEVIGEILETANEARRPRLVDAPVFVVTDDGPYPQKAANTP